MNILGNTGARHVILDRRDTLQELNDKFPGLVKEIKLFTLKSKLYQKLLEVYMIKVDVELVRFGILFDGIDSHQVVNLKGKTSDYIEYEL